MKVGDKIKVDFAGKKKDALVFKLFPNSVYLKVDFNKDKGKTIKIINQILNGEKPKPGSYRGRKNSEPELSRKTLLENKNAQR